MTPEEVLPVSAPTVHLNGTSGEHLSSIYDAARTALQSALRAVVETYPNGRDYYPQGPMAISTAMAQHRRRVERIEDVLVEMGRICESVEEQVEARRRK